MIAGVRALRLVSDALCIGMSFAVEQTDASIQLLPLLSSSSIFNTQQMTD
jgi:hypothetical protein